MNDDSTSGSLGQLYVTVYLKCLVVVVGARTVMFVVVVMTVMRTASDSVYKPLAPRLVFFLKNILFL